MHRLAAAAAVVVLLSAWVAGCAQPGDAGGMDVSFADDADVTVVSGAASDCVATQLVLLVDFDTTDAFLPPNYVPRDARGFLGLDVGTGQTAAVQTALACQASDIAPAGHRTAFLSIFIEPPEMPGFEDHLSADHGIHYDFYEVQRHNVDGPLRDLMESWQWPSDEATEIPVERVALDGRAAASGASARDDGGVVFSFQGAPAAATPQGEGLMRVWRDLPDGTAVRDYILDFDLHTGPGVCHARTGTPMAHFLEGQRCPPSEAIVIDYASFDLEGSYLHVPGVRPR